MASRSTRIHTVRRHFLTRTRQLAGLVAMAITAVLATAVITFVAPGTAAASSYIGPSVTNPPTMTSLAAGTEHTCLIRTDTGRDSSVWCTGMNTHGQLGTGTTVRSLQFVPSLITSATSVAAGGDTTCAVRTDATLWCWGTLPTALDPLATRPTVTYADVLSPAQMPLVGVRSVAVGRRHHCAVLLNGTAWCWGANEHGQLGDGTTNDSVTPVRVRQSKIAQLDVGNEHSCAVRATSTVWCWGSNGYKRVGQKKVTKFVLPTNVPGVKATSVATGAAFTCVIATIGRVQCWGRNNYGQLARTKGPSRAAPHTTGIKKPVTLSAGDEFACATTQANTTWCWGRNRFGQLAQGHTFFRSRPQKIVADPIVGTLSSVAAGASHACSTTAASPGLPSGALWCWGLSLQGQLGDSGSDTRPNGIAVWPSDVQMAAIGSASAARLVVVGDMVCELAQRFQYGTGPLARQCGEEHTAALAIGINPDAVLMVGDTDNGIASYDDYMTWWEPTWGPLKSRTYPIRGNHEYLTPGASGYTEYFDQNSPSYWWTDAGGWRILGVDTWCQGLLFDGCSDTSPQTTWLTAQLARAKAEGKCVALAMHHPLVSSGRFDTSTVAPLWRAAVAGGADLVFSGHEHFYERFEPLGADGLPSATGVPLFIVGTGGALGFGFSETHPGSAFRYSATKGVLTLDLAPGSYSFAFRSALDSSVIEQGNGTCVP